MSSWEKWWIEKSAFLPSLLPQQSDPHCCHVFPTGCMAMSRSLPLVLRGLSQALLMKSPHSTPLFPAPALFRDTVAFFVSSREAGS